MPITGSQKALMQCRSGVERCGATRTGYFTPNVIVSINGTNRATFVEIQSLRVTQELNDAPDTAQFTVKPNTTFVPTSGHTAIVALGHVDGYRDFAGQIVRAKHRRESGLLEYPWYDVECLDWAGLFDRRRIQTYYASQSATDIVKAIIDTYTSGFTRVNVQDGLDTIELFTAVLEQPTKALRRLANMIGGGFYIDAFKDVHFFGPAGESGSRTPTAPMELNNTRSTLMAFRYREDRSQLRTRMLVETKGGQTLTDVAAGQMALPLDDVSNFLSPSQALIEGYGPLGVFLRSPLGAATSTTAGVSAGATTIPVTNVLAITPAGVGLPGWIKSFDSDQMIYFAGVSGSDLTGVPTSGPGAIRQDIPINTLVYHLPQIALAQALTVDVPAGTSVTPLTTVDDAAAQATQAALEGGDGIHETPIQDRRFNQGNADALGNADLDAFSDSIDEVEWVTRDMNARVGSRQVVNFTGTDAYSTTVTITRVDVEYRDRRQVVPLRRCSGAVVRPATLRDITNTDRGR